MLFLHTTLRGYVSLRMPCRDLINNKTVVINVPDPFSLWVSLTVLQSMKLGIDVNRHKEIIVKSVSALLLLLLKHFKLNHVYQVGVQGCPRTS